MGSIQKRQYFDRMHKRYGEKYPELDVKMIKEIRQKFLTGKLTKEQVIESFMKKIESEEAFLEQLQDQHDKRVKAFNWLQTCSEEMFADITDRNPKSMKGEVKPNE